MKMESIRNNSMAIEKIGKIFNWQTVLPETSHPSAGDWIQILVHDREHLVIGYIPSSECIFFSKTH